MKLSHLFGVSLALTSGLAGAEVIEGVEEEISTTIYWTSGVTKEGGWYDINKSSLKPEEVEENMCYAASATNIIAWWQDGGWQGEDKVFQPNQAAPSTIDGIWEQYKEHNDYPDEGGDPLSAINWWISGIYAPIDENGKIAEEGDPIWDRFYDTYDNLVDDSDDDSEQLDTLTLSPIPGYYYDQYGLTKTDLSELLEEVWNEDSGVSAEDIDFIGLLESGAALSLGILDGGELAHALTLWGVEYDEDENLVQLWLTDSDDADETESKEILFSAAVTLKDDGKFYLETYGEGAYIGTVYAFNAPVTKNWQMIPEPTTATLSLLSLAALAARRRRK